MTHPYVNPNAGVTQAQYDQFLPLLKQLATFSQEIYDHLGQERKRIKTSQDPDAYKTIALQLADFGSLSMSLNRSVDDIDGPLKSQWGEGPFHYDYIKGDCPQCGPKYKKLAQRQLQPTLDQAQEARSQELERKQR